MENIIKVYTYAVADLLHIGHLRAFRQAKALGDYLIVGILTDEATAVYKRIPIIPFEERCAMVQSLKCVDEVVRQDSLDPTENLKKYRPDILTHSHGENGEFPGNPDLSLVKKAVRTEYYPHQSTTRIINKIRKTKNK